MSVTTDIPLPTFVLPGRWWRVPLDSPERIAASTRAMGKALYPGDELASLRAEIRQRVESAAGEAAQAGARAFHFAVEVVPGVPVPLTLGLFQPDLPPRLSARTGPVAAAEALGASFREGGSGAAVSTWGDDAIGVVRVLSTQEPVPGAEVDRPVLRTDYWLTAAGSDATTVFSFSAPVIWEQTAPALLELMDAVIATVQWSPSDDRTGN
jgi:hypothetical protein